MMIEVDTGRLRLLAKPTLPAFEVRVVVIPGGSQMRFDDRQWRDHLVELSADTFFFGLEARAHSSAPKATCSHLLVCRSGLCTTLFENPPLS